MRRKKGGADLLLHWRQIPKRRRQLRGTQTCASSCHARSARVRGAQRTAGRLRLPWATGDPIIDDNAQPGDLCAGQVLFFDMDVKTAANVSVCMTLFREKHFMAVYLRWPSYLSGSGCS